MIFRDNFEIPRDATPDELNYMLRSVTICILLRIQHVSTKAIIVVCFSAFRVSGHKPTSMEFSLTGTSRNFSPKSFSKILMPIIMVRDSGMTWLPVISYNTWCP
ncbi:UDP-N-acetylmuramate--L-alanine ligase [Sesbania bispinosa]|nr:UDP-N-acetylmuramate--L-alanine ligase [Sesbania bispinosa]